MFLKFLLFAGALWWSLQLLVYAQGTAATGQQSGFQSNRSWQNAFPQAAPGNSDAGLGRSFPTNVRLNGAQLPQCNTGLNALLSGFNKPAVRQFGSGGFSGGGSRPYTGCYGSGQAGGTLPPCAMTPCDFDVAEGCGSSAGGNGAGGDPYGYHQGDGNQGGGDPYGFHQGEGAPGSGADPYGFHQGSGSSGGDPYGFHGGN